MTKPTTPLNPIFADMPLSKLITTMETNSVFRCEELERELDARLERIGKRWSYARGGRIDISDR